jgi:hypothetical protein
MNSNKQQTSQGRDGGEEKGQKWGKGKGEADDDEVTIICEIVAIELHRENLRHVLASLPVKSLDLIGT